MKIQNNVKDQTKRLQMPKICLFSTICTLILHLLGIKFCLSRLEKLSNSTGSNVLHPKKGGLNEVLWGGSQEGGQDQ